MLTQPGLHGRPSADGPPVRVDADGYVNSDRPSHFNIFIGGRMDELRPLRPGL